MAKTEEGNLVSVSVEQTMTDHSGPANGKLNSKNVVCHSLSADHGKKDKIRKEIEEVDVNSTWREVEREKKRGERARKPSW